LVITVYKQVEVEVKEDLLSSIISVDISASDIDALTTIIYGLGLLPEPIPALLLLKELRYTSIRKLLIYSM
jgi:hypothetical protein